MKYSWLFGSSAIDNLVAVNHSLRKKTLDAVNRKLNSRYSVFSPWMSDLEKVENLRGAFGNSEFILTDAETLSTIRKNCDPFNMREDRREVLKYISIDAPTTREISTFRAALNTIYASHCDVSHQVTCLVQQIVPVRTARGKVQSVGVGCSTQQARGAIFLSVPDLGNHSSIQLAINIAHEVGHQALMVYETADLILRVPEEEVYSHVRNCPRPALQSFHAMVALGYMNNFLSNFPSDSLESEDDRNFLAERKHSIKKDFEESVALFEEKAFTPLGHRLYQELAEHAEAI